MLAQRLGDDHGFTQKKNCYIEQGGTVQIKLHTQGSTRGVVCEWSEQRAAINVLIVASELKKLE